MSREEDKLKNSLQKLVESRLFPFDPENWEKMSALSDEEQLKSNLQDLVESKEFAFDEANWDKADRLMHPEDWRNRPVLWWSAAALLLLTLGVLSYYYFAPLPSQTAHRVPATKITAQPEAQSAAEPSTPAPAEKTSHAAPSSKTLSNPNTTGSPGAPEEPAAKQLPDPNPAGSFSSHSGKAQSDAVSAHAAAPAKPAKSAKQLPVAGKQDAVDPPADPAAKTDPVTAAKNERTENPDPANDLPVAAKTALQVPNSAAGAPQPAAKDRTAKSEETTPLTSADPAGEAQISSVYLPFKPLEAAPAAEDLMASTITDIPLPLPEKRLIMNFEVGGNYLLGWNNGSGTDARGFNPVVGFNYYNYLTNRASISFGAQYTSVNGLSYASHTSKTTRYNLGEESAVTVFTPEKVHYITVPLKLNYSLDEENAFGLGANFSYLLTVDAKKETYSTTYNRRENYESYKTTGYTEGFAAFDLQLSAFYRRKIYRNLSVNAELVYGLSDVKNDGFFKSNVFERNTGIKLTLLYNVFR